MISQEIKKPVYKTSALDLSHLFYALAEANASAASQEKKPSVAQQLLPMVVPAELSKGRSNAYQQAFAEALRERTKIFANEKFGENAVGQKSTVVFEKPLGDLKYGAYAFVTDWARNLKSPTGPQRETKFGGFPITVPELEKSGPDSWVHRLHSYLLKNNCEATYSDELSALILELTPQIRATQIEQIFTAYEAEPSSDALKILEEMENKPQYAYFIQEYQQKQATMEVISPEEEIAFIVKSKELVDVLAIATFTEFEPEHVAGFGLQLKFFKIAARLGEGASGYQLYKVWVTEVANRLSELFILVEQAKEVGSEKQFAQLVQGIAQQTMSTVNAQIPKEHYELYLTLDRVQQATAKKSELRAQGESTPAAEFKALRQLDVFAHPYAPRPKA